MTRIILPNGQWDQPTDPSVRIAEQYRANVKSAIIGGLRYDVARRKTHFGLGVGQANKNGLTAQQTWNGAQYLSYEIEADANVIVPTGSNVTILTQHYKFGDVGSNIVWYLGSASGGSSAEIYPPFSDGKLYWRWAGAVNGTTAVEVSGLTYKEDDWFAFTVGPRGMEVWQNFKLVGSHTNIPSRTASSGPAVLGYIGGGNTNTSYTRFSLFATLDKQLDVGFLSGGNYWGLFEAPPIEIYVPAAGGGAVTVSVDAAAETDAAQALGKLKARALSAAAETDSAQAVAARKTLAVSVATEADAAHAVGKAKTLAVGHAAETDTAQTIAPLGAIVEAVTAATEIDSAQNVGRIKTLALGASAEADAAQAIAVVIAGEQIVSVAAAAETDTAQVIGARKTLSLASINETDAAQIILPRKELAVQPATEADSAQAIAWAPKILQLGVATETDQAQAITLAAAGLTLEQKCDLLLKLLRNKQITDPATGLMTIYDDDDTTPLLTANIYEDAAGTVLYRGRGAERRERLQ